MIVFINGSLGVGKTSVAHDLLWRAPQTVLLEGDALCNLHPFDAYDPRRIETLIDIIRYMIVQYQKMGYHRFIVDSIFEKTTEVQALHRVLAGLDPTMGHYLLVSDDGRREENIRKRNRDNFLWEIQRSLELQNLLVAEFHNSTEVRTLDVSTLSVKDVGDWILRDLAIPPLPGRNSFPIP